MAQPKYSIGIDLGTSNSVLAYCSLAGAGRSDVLAVPQWDTPSTVIDSATVPSFLYRPEEAADAMYHHICEVEEALKRMVEPEDSAEIPRTRADAR